MFMTYIHTELYKPHSNGTSIMTIKPKDSYKFIPEAMLFHIFSSTDLSETYMFSERLLSYRIYEHHIKWHKCRSTLEVRNAAMFIGNYKLYSRRQSLVT
jgi:hypothetical protein